MSLPSEPNEPPVLTAFMGDIVQSEPRFGAEGFYPGAGRQVFLDQIVYVDQFVEGVVLVLGDAGSGKTTLAHAFFEMSPPLEHRCLIEAGRLACSGDVFAAITESLELPFEGAPGQHLAELRSYIQNEQSAPLHLVIDDADLLDDQVLSALLSLFQGDVEGQSGIQLVMFGRDDLVKRIDAFQMVDVRVNDLYIPPVAPEEMAGYLQFKSQGWGVAALNADDLDDIAQRSNGNLGVASYLLQQVLQAPDPEEKPRKGFGLWHLVAVIVLLTVLPLMYLYHDSADETEVKRSSMPAPVPGPEPEQVALAPAAGVVGVVGNRPVEVARPESVEPGPAAESAVSVSLPDQSVAASEPESAVEGEPLGAKHPLSDITRQADEPADISAKPTGVAVKAPASPATVKVVQSGLSADEAAILAEPERYFTLQVLGVSSRDAAEQYRERQANKADLRLFEGRRNGKPWFALIVGSYPDKSAARAALEALPSAQRKAGPWPRSYLSVQMEIKALKQ